MRRIGITALESVSAVAVASLIVAVLDTFSPIAGLGVVYLLAVLWIAVRRGRLAALFTAVLGVLTLNFFFIEPLYRLTVDHSENLIMLIVLLVAALVVGQLATLARHRETQAEANHRAEIAKSAVLHAISHDLRSPLTSITTASGALRKGQLSQTDHDDLVNVIDTESARLAQLVDDLLDLSQIEADAVDPRMDWCDLHDVLTRSLAEARLSTAHPIDLVLTPQLPFVKADAVQLERVFTNLISNAAKFSPAKSPIRIRTTVNKDVITIRVCDGGAGIPLDSQPQIFEPFFRGRNNTGKQGSGLGLAICRGFVEANNGQIALETDNPLGTTFAVSFPLEQQPQPVS